MIHGLEKLTDSGQPGLAELRSVLLRLFDGSGVTGRLIGQQSLKGHKVYRLRFEIDGQARTVVVKRLNPTVAQRNQLVATRWLPAVGLRRSGPDLLGVAADRAARCIWHVYEDLGDCSLESTRLERARVEAAITLIARLHVRFAEHPLLAECRMYGHDLGIAFYIANMRDAIRALESLQPPSVELDSDDVALRDRLLHRLYRLLEEGPDRGQMMAERSGPETLIHGDLWPENVRVVPTQNGVQTRLIDWDKTGAGPVTYDLSTLLYRFPAHDRAWVLDRYQQVVEPVGWHAPSTTELSLLLETAEISRVANCLIWPCIEAVHAQAGWAFDSLSEIETWFESIEPAL
jgi:aminoglycoside/choline kinase family phosphotransferase